MAKEGVYGEAGKPNESPTFAVPGVGGVLSVEVNKQTGVSQIYKQGAGNTQQSLGTYDPSTGKFTPQKDSNENTVPTEAEIRSLSSANGINAINNAAKTTATKGLIAEGKDTQTAQTEANQLLTKNTASQIPTTEQFQTAIEQLDTTTVSGTRNTAGSFGDLKYPDNLKSEYQDVIKFTMLKYRPKSFTSSPGTVPTFSDRQTSEADILGTTVLPINGGISDTNSVSWGQDTMSPAEVAAASVALTAITEGAESAINKGGEYLQNALKDSKDLKAALAVGFAQNATGVTGLLARTRGVVINPNMELLFQGPSLRPFNFTFKLSARGPEDGDQIRRIIRFFKQGMAAQRTESQLFLKSPNTFKIQYLHKNKDHPYINYIKECALQSFTVNYTPEGNYMTFGDGLMTSYEISMQFQELEPIFNDDYSKLPGGNNDTVIGY